MIERNNMLINKIVEEATNRGERLTENRIKILRLILDNPYISKYELASNIGISYTAITNNIKVMRGKYVRRVGPDKGGFWEVLI